MRKMIAIAAAALVATLAAPAVLAMGQKPSAEPAPAPSRQAVAEYDALGVLVNEATLAIQPNRATEAERSAALPAFRRLTASVEAAYKATTAAPFSQATFDRRAAEARKHHADTCSQLPGC